ncbi:MAG: hypothetical protein JWQ04_2528 [Pedosphaera sp.]|nr:hypothetical protein [Pedosphaera sp.]
MRGGAVKLIGKRLLDSVLRPGEVKDLTALANILLQNEQQEIQRAWLTLARDKYHFKASQAALKVLPLVDEMSQEAEERELARIEKIKRTLFGDEVDKIQEPGRTPNAQWGRETIQNLDAFD